MHVMGFEINRVVSPVDGNLISVWRNLNLELSVVWFRNFRSSDQFNSRRIQFFSSTFSMQNWARKHLAGGRGNRGLIARPGWSHITRQRWLTHIMLKSLCQICKIMKEKNNNSLTDAITHHQPCQKGKFKKMLRWIWWWNHALLN